MSFRYLPFITPCLALSFGLVASAIAEVHVPEGYRVELDGPLTNVVIEDQKAGEHRVWVHDWAGALYSKAVLYNGDDGTVMGSVETGWEGVALDLPSSGDVIYNSALFMSRGYHGERTDVVEMYDPSTLHLLGEIEIPPKAGRGIPNRNHSDISDDDRFLFLTFFTPASSVGVVDLQSKKYLGEIETAGCAYVLASGPRQFFVICGDGSLLAINVDDAGKEVARKRYSDVFDAIEDPLHGTAERSGDTWYFTSHRGVIHGVDVSGSDLKPRRLFDGGEKGSATTAWVPSEMYQNLAVHSASRRLFLLVGEQDMRPKGGGHDFHRKGGTEVRVFDIDSGELLRRIPLPAEAFTIAVSQDDAPLLYSASIWTPSIAVMDADSGKHLREMVSAFGSMNTIIQPLEPR